MPVTVAVGDGAVVGSWIILVPTMYVLSLSVAVGRTDPTGDLLLGLEVTVGEATNDGSRLKTWDVVSGVGVVDEVLTGADESGIVELVEPRGALVGIGVSVVDTLLDDGGTSETGIPVEDDVGTSVEMPEPVGVGVISVPDEMPEGGNTPEVVPGIKVETPEDAVVISEGVSEGVTGVSEGITDKVAEISVTVTGSVVGRSVGAAEKTEETTLDRRLSIGTGVVPVGTIDWISDTTLEAMLETMLDTSGIAVGSSEATDDTKLESSEIKEGTMGITPSVGVVVGAVGPRVGSVKPAPEVGVRPGTVSEGRTDGNSDSTDDNRGSPPDCDVLSETGIALDAVGVGVLGSDVPSAVVIPTKMPEVGNVGVATSEVADRTSLVGSTGLLGTPPEVPVGATFRGSDGTMSVGRGRTPVEPKRGTFSEPVGRMSVGSLSVGVDSRSGSLDDPDGCTMLDGKPPVEPVPGMMKGPRIVEPAVEAASPVEEGAAVG
jgi:hypothetical protein